MEPSLQVRSKQRRVRSRTRFRFILPILSLILASIAVWITPTPASADGLVYGWGTGTYIAVDTGAKNFSNHTQWVRTISIIDGANRCDGGTAEAWISRPGVTDWYASRAMCGYTTFDIYRWVPSGSSVCGSNWFYQDKRWWRGVACIKITV